MNLDLLYFTATIVQPANRKRAAFWNEFTSSLRDIWRFWHRFPYIYIQSVKIVTDLDRSSLWRFGRLWTPWTTARLESWTGFDEFRWNGNKGCASFPKRRCSSWPDLEAALLDSAPHWHTGKLLLETSIPIPESISKSNWIGKVWWEWIKLDSREWIKLDHVFPKKS